MESQPQNPEFRINPETFTHGEVIECQAKFKVSSPTRCMYKG